MAKVTDPYLNYDEQRRTRSRVMLLITLGLVVIIGGGWGAWAIITAPATAEVGMCLAETPAGEDPSFVDCTDADARYRIVGTIDGIFANDAAGQCLSQFGSGLVYYQEGNTDHLALCLSSST